MSTISRSLIISVYSYAFLTWKAENERLQSVWEFALQAHWLFLGKEMLQLFSGRKTLKRNHVLVSSGSIWKRCNARATQKQYMNFAVFFQPRKERRLVLKVSEDACLWGTSEWGWHKRTVLVEHMCYCGITKYCHITFRSRDGPRKLPPA